MQWTETVLYPSGLQSLNFPKQWRPLSLFLTTYLSMYWPKNLISSDSSSAAVREINSCAGDNVGKKHLVYAAISTAIKFGDNLRINFPCPLTWVCVPGNKCLNHNILPSFHQIDEFPAHTRQICQCQSWRARIEWLCMVSVYNLCETSITV